MKSLPQNLSLRAAIFFAVGMILGPNSMLYGEKLTPDSQFGQGRLAASPTPPKNAVVLFDGSNLDSWARQKPKKWEEPDGPAQWKILEQGQMEVVPASGSVITKRKFGDMKLHLEFRLLGGKTNGGVYLQSRYEININEAHGESSGSPCGEFANLAKPIAPLKRAALPPLHWQTLEVDFRAPRFDENEKLTELARATVFLNGEIIHDNVELGKRKGAAKRLGDAATGPLMLQEHGVAYQFRNIWIVDKSE